MRVLVVSHACVVDINQELFVEIAKFPGVELALVVPKMWRTGLRGKLAFRRLSKLRSKVYVLAAFLSGDDFRMHASFYPSWWKPIQDFNPDIIHIDEEAHALMTLQFALSGKRRGAKVLFCSFQNIRKSYPPPFSAVERMVFRASSCGVARTEEARSVLRSKGYSKKVFVIPPAVKLSWCCAKDVSSLGTRSPSRDITIGYVGRIAEEKGVGDFVSALSLLIERDEKFHSLIIGSGPGEEAVKRMVRDLGLNGFVTMIPTVPHNRIAEYYNCMDILVLPSQTTKGWKEQFGRVLIEAMACGVAVVGSDSGEIPNIIRETGSGLIFREGDVNDLATKISQLLGDQEYRKFLGRQGKEGVEKRYSSKEVAKNFYQVYRSLMQDAC